MPSPLGWICGVGSRSRIHRPENYCGKILKGIRSPYLEHHCYDGLQTPVRCIPRRLVWGCKKCRPKPCSKWGLQISLLSSTSTCPTSTLLWPTQQSLFRIPPPAHVHLTPGNPVPMDIDAGWKKYPTLLTCYRCHKPGHKAPDCPERFNVRLLMIEELKIELMNRKDTLLKEILVTGVECEISEEEDFVQDNKWKACPHCWPVIVFKY